MNWNATKDENNLIAAIATRFGDFAKQYGIQQNWLDTRMDLEACHCNGCPLDLPRMATARPQDLIHDVMGINANINRDTGKLENCFVPRFAKIRKG